VTSFNQRAGLWRDAVVGGTGQCGGIAFLVGIQAIAVLIAQLLVVGSQIELGTRRLSTEAVYATNVGGGVLVVFLSATSLCALGGGFFDAVVTGVELEAVA